MSKVLVTGGAGFIGSHLTDKLLERGLAVRVLDALERPTHTSDTPLNLDPRAEFLRGEVGDEQLLERALDDVEVIFHLAATGGFRAGVSRYVERNSLHTARLIDVLAARRERPRRIIVASSVAVYGEGAYRCPDDGEVQVAARRAADLTRGRFEPRCPRCGGEVSLEPTRETRGVSPERPYSLSKYDQERIVLNAADELGVEAVALRYFVTFGPRQALTNPYTGVLSLFANRIRHGLAPVVYEDGMQSRDFVDVDDLVAAHLLVLDAKQIPHRVMNVGSGRATTLEGLAREVARALGSNIKPEVPGRFRLGDVRHITADISRIAGLGYRPKLSLRQGVERYVAWLSSQPEVPDGFADAEREVAASGLLGEVHGS